MDNENLHGGNEPEYPREIYEPVLAPSIDLDAYLKQELTISYFNTDGDHEMAHFSLSEEEAQTVINEYFVIVER